MEAMKTTTNGHGGVGALLRYRPDHSAVIVRESACAWTILTFPS